MLENMVENAITWYWLMNISPVLISSNISTFSTGFMSNKKEAVFAMMAATSLGAIWVGILPLSGSQVRRNVPFKGDNNIKIKHSVFYTSHSLHLINIPFNWMCHFFSCHHNIN